MTFKKATTRLLLMSIALLNGSIVQGQIKMFDDFNYQNVNDPALSSFNKWNTVNGTNGPPDGALYSKNNIAFKEDPTQQGNSLITLSTTVNGQSKAITNSRIETSGFEYFEGTYASRVYVSNVPFEYQDANIQTFYTIVSYELGNNGSVYSELDFEYMASDYWGTATKQPVMYLTSWNRYIPEPWQAWKRYFSYQKSMQGWHTFVVSCTDGTNVKYWIDGEYMGSMATTDSDGTSVYPRSPMQIAFANWIWNYATGPNQDNRTTTMEVDWVLFVKNQEMSPIQVSATVGDYRNKGIIRENITGDLAYRNVTQSPFKTISLPGTFQAEDYDIGGPNIAFRDSDGINEGGEYRNDAVDVEMNGEGGYNIGYVKPEEWLEFTVNVAQSNIYSISARVANGSSDIGVFHFEIDGQTIGESVSIANTGGWQEWIYTSLGETTLAQGETTIRLIFDSEGINVDEVQFTIDTITHIKNTQNKNFKIYPNPAAEYLTVSSHASLIGKAAIILNNEGKVVKETYLNEQIDISNLTPGVYSLKIRLENSYIVEPFIKK